MMLLRTLAPLFLLVFLGHHISLSSGKRQKNRGGGRNETSPAAAAAAGLRAPRGRDKPTATGRGKFSSSKAMQCTWDARDVEETVRLSVKCESQEAREKGGVTDMKCQYDGKPHSCPGYESDPKGFWKQVGRAFKKLKEKVCVDERALVKAGMCKRAPRDAHFKLDVTSSVSAGQSGPDTPRRIRPTPPPLEALPAGSTNCTGRADHQRKSVENCGNWASVCSFFFSMLQSEDC